ncbi:hypothetical protein KY328_05260 [Candidatus Woesearchaeota archaeon]|nr:hypothetical protein [Candidatus Woesearchaeota archaeon]MBW3022306.1 hypothetical protein [Candidatus Woesearchaeota archaeon]
MKRVIFFCFFIFILVLVIGCSKDSDVSVGSAVDVVEVRTGNWCEPGSQWTGFDFEKQGLEQGDMLIKGLEDEYCHVRYRSRVDSVDFYFKKDGSGYYLVGDFKGTI